MAYNAPPSVTTGQLATASDHNTYSKDNIIALRAGEIALTSQAAGDVITASSSTQLSRVAPGTAGMVLTSNGALSAPSFKMGGNVVSVLTDGATPALDASLGNVFTLSAAGDRTIAVPSNATSGQKIVIRHLASGADRTLALNSGAGGFRFGADITALTATTSAKTDYIGCIYNATDSKWDVVAYVKGY
jgi:hypothetical protein